MVMAAAKKILVKQTRSINDTLENQKRTIKALGLGRPNYVAIHNDTPAIRGMIRTVQHLVKVEDVK
jgi:large subunit ribosomal protein L30